MTTSRLLSLADIADVRAYEAEREKLRDRIIALKQLRRVSLGELVSVVFENSETVRFQVQEMARAEGLISDQQIQAELDVYNSLIPAAGELSATLFLELRSKAELQHWLPKLVGIEKSIVLRVGEGDNFTEVHSIAEASHEANLTREDVTASVHYVRWQLDAASIDAFATKPVRLLVDHPAYEAEALLGEGTKKSLLGDLTG